MDWFGLKKSEISETTEAEKRLHRCAFTGHRPEKLNRSEKETKTALKKAIEQSITDGYTVFISGMARGVDLWAAEIVLKLRRRNKTIKLICAVPYEGFESRWSQTWQALYRSVLNQADIVRYVGKEYTPDVFWLRNQWMVNHSARLIAAFNGTSGGTRNTIEYARQVGVEILTI